MQNFLYQAITMGLILTACFAYGHEPGHIDEHGHHHDEHHHAHHKNEIGFAAGPVYSFEEEHFAAGLHLHYLRNMGKSKQRFGIGAGGEVLLDEHRHYTISAIALYRPFSKFSVALSPGVAISFESGETELSPAGHLEVAYEFEINNLHLGPVAELAVGKHDYHIMFGMHVGIGF